MPMPMMPQVPTSRRLRGSYMSTMLRVKSSVLAPSLTSDGVGAGLDHVADHAQRAVEVHRRRVQRQRRRHLRQVLVLAFGDRAGPLGRRLGPVGADAGQQRRHAGADVADQRRGDGHVAVDLGRRDVDLDELLGARVAGPRSCPCRATAASSAARRPASRRRPRPARRSARPMPTAHGCRAAGPWPSTSAGRGCRSSRPARGCRHRPARRPRPCRAGSAGAWRP